MKKALKWIAIMLVVLVIGLVIAVQLRWDRQFERPLPELTASDDPAVIERGRHLVWGPAHCAGCHGQLDRLEEYERDATVVPLTGGFEFDIPPGIIRVPNLTSDPETGIGKMSDAQIARALRHGVGRDGRTLFPIMPFQHLADDDIVAIISYLRTLPPERHEVAPTELSFLGKALFAFAIEPAGPSEPVAKAMAVSREPSYGEYLAKNVANCYGCHTDRDLKTGEFIGKPFAGGLHFEHRGKTYVPPNITPGADGSKIAAFDADGFIARVRLGTPSAEGSPMPWAAFKTMTDDELHAIWAFLQTVPRVDGDVGPAVLTK